MENEKTTEEKEKQENKRNLFKGIIWAFAFIAVVILVLVFIPRTDRVYCDPQSPVSACIAGNYEPVCTNDNVVEETPCAACAKGAEYYEKGFC
jgi:hypothetical protein